MPIATIEANVPFQQTNMLDSLYKGQTQRLDVNKAEADAANAGVDREELIRKRKAQILARDVFALDNEEKWNQLGPDLAAKYGIEFKPWDGGVHRDRILAMGSEVDPQLLGIKEMAATKSAQETRNPSILAGKILEMAAADPSLANEPGFASRIQWANAIMTNAQKIIGVPQGGNVYAAPTYPGSNVPPASNAPPINTGESPPRADAPPPAGPQPIFRGAMPAEMTKLQGENKSKITAYNLNLDHVNSAIDAFDKNPELLKGGVTDRFGYAINAARGATTDEGVAYNQAYQSIVEVSNADLLDAKGTQTEGDAVRAMAKFLDSPGDRKLMQLALTKIKNALEEKRKTAEGINSQIDSTYGPLGGGQPSAAQPGAAPKGFTVRRN